MNAPILSRPHVAYYAAMAAEASLSTNLTRQFGKRAVDARYRLDMRKQWDDATRAAGIAWDAAVLEMRMAMRGAA